MSHYVLYRPATGEFVAVEPSKIQGEPIGWCFKREMAWKPRDVGAACVAAARLNETGLRILVLSGND